MKYEILKANCYYHIFNQGNNGEDIFIEEMNYNYFLRLLTKYLSPVANVYSYCLLKNHFHLLVRIKEVKEEKLISKSFSNLFNAYAKAINKKYHRSGSLFRDRFKRIQVKEEIYLRQLIVYINLNPIYHGFTSDIKSYKHSSYLGLLSVKETMLKRDEVMALFDNRNNFKYHLHQKQVEFDERMKGLILE